MIFSRRKIMFHYQVALWECQCAAWREATGTNNFPFSPSSKGTESLMNHWQWKNTFGLWPDVLQYIKLVHQYNNRQLTFPADGLQAIAGLLAVMNKSFHGGFICGLPQMFFDDALLWQPYDVLQRRNPEPHGNARNVLPSWSWVGWQGEIESEQWASQWDYISLTIHRKAVVWKLNSTVEWSYGESRENRQAVEVSSYRYRRCFTDESILLPPDWSRKNGSTVHDYFVHARFPGINFAYPIPLPERDQQNRFQPLPQFLFGRTRRGFFKGFRERSGVSTFISLLDHYGKWTGMIKLHDNTHIAAIDNRGLGDSSELELVSISAGAATSETSLYKFEYMAVCRDGLKNADVYEFYNVLWIEWKEGVAYRKGLGRVRKQAWERQATEWIDLTLG